MRAQTGKSCCRIVLGCGVFLYALSSAWGGSPDAQERAARKACLLGDVAKGTEILADLYLDTKNPTHIYNQGRCFEQNGLYDQAILRFREYLRKAEKLPAAEVNALEKRIKELEGKPRGVPATAGTPANPSPTTVARPNLAAPSSLPPSAAVAPDPEPLPIIQPTDPSPQKSHPVYKRWWFWTGIGVVVAGGVVAAVLLGSRSGTLHSPPCASSSEVTCVPQ